MLMDIVTALVIWFLISTTWILALVSFVCVIGLVWVGFRFVYSWLLELYEWWSAPWYKKD